MNTNDSIPVGERDEVIELGIASVETLGFPGMPTEGVNLRIAPGISEG